VAFNNTTPRWQVLADNNANGGLPLEIFWRENTSGVAVPVDQWFKLEVFSRRSSGADGRMWAAIHGQKIVDRFGSLMGVNNAPIDRIFLVRPAVRTALIGTLGTRRVSRAGLLVGDGALALELHRLVDLFLCLLHGLLRLLHLLLPDRGTGCGAGRRVGAAAGEQREASQGYEGCELHRFSIACRRRGYIPILLSLPS
jgi:hypothetical protein